MKSATTHSRSTGLVWTAAFVMSVGLGCVRRDDVQVRVVYENGADAKPVENFTVFVGANKSWWATISPGESVSVVLPPAGEPPQVSAIYTAAGSKKDWRGPSLPAGAGYAVELRLAPNGALTERHCTRPCSLP